MVSRPEVALILSDVGNGICLRKAAQKTTILALQSSAQSLDLSGGHGVVTDRDSNASQQFVHKTSGQREWDRFNAIAETCTLMAYPSGINASYFASWLEAWGPDWGSCMNTPLLPNAPHLMTITEPPLFRTCHTSNATRLINALFSFLS